MKKTIVTLLIGMGAVILVCMLAGCGSSRNQDVPKEMKPSGRLLENRVVAYYFHGNFRCPTCRKLEQYSQEAIQQNFGSELALGTVVFEAINVDESKNQHFINDYQLYTKSLVLSLVKNGKEVKNKNLTMIWQLVGNKNEFLDYVKFELEDFLKDL